MTGSVVAPKRRRIRDHVWYRFESHITGSPFRVIAWLGTLAVSLAFLGGLTLWVIHGQPNDPDANVPEALWESTTRLLDPGTFSGDAGWQRRAVTLLVTLCGLLVTSVLIGLTSAGFDEKLHDLRRGRGRVLESGHTLVLGWSPRIYVLLSELLEANANQRGATIVVLANEDAAWMNDQVRHRMPHRGRTRIICRSGEPSSVADLVRVHARDARTIVVLGPDGRNDAPAIKSMLGLVAIGVDFDAIPVVVELQDGRNARDLAVHNRIVPVRSDEVVAIVTAQALRQPGVAEVLTNLLDFTGDEIYFLTMPELAGRTFGEAQLQLANSCLIGLHNADGTAIAPPPDRLITTVDQLVVIAGDDDTTVAGDYSGAVAIPGPSPEDVASDRAPERLLVLHWNHLGTRILEELDGYVPPGSKVVVVADSELFPTLAIDASLRNIQVEVEVVDDDLNRSLQILDEHAFDHVLVLSYRDHLADEASDARGLLSVLTIDRRLIGSRRRPRLVAELLDDRSAALMQTAGADDFVITTSLSGLLLAQLAERIELMNVVRELFDVSGARVEMVNAGDYLHLASGPRTFRFDDLVATVTRCSGVLIGVHTPNHPARLNPPKHEEIELLAEDKLVIIQPERPPGAVVNLTSAANETVS